MRCADRTAPKQRRWKSLYGERRSRQQIEQNDTADRSKCFLWTKTRISILQLNAADHETTRHYHGELLQFLFPQQAKAHEMHRVYAIGC